MNVLLQRWNKLSQIEYQETRAIIAAFGFGFLFFFISLYLYNKGAFNSPETSFMGLLLPTLYLLFIIIYLIGILVFPTLCAKSRKYSLTLIHTSFLTLAIANANEYGVIAVPMYLWLIMASGIRFGPRYLYFAITITTINMMLLITFHPYWHEEFMMSIAVLFSLILVPFSYIGVVTRMHKANAILRDNLKQMRYQAKHDFLTGLPNRAYLQSELLQKISDTEVKSGDFALIFIDLDGFKKVNDSLGHHIGDEILKEVGKRLREVSRNPHFVARLGGDEFVILFDAKDSLQRLLEEILTTLSNPYIHKVDTISASIGVAYYDAYAYAYADDAELCASQLKKEADAAMYQAKDLGRNQAYIHNAEIKA